MNYMFNVHILCFCYDIRNNLAVSPDKNLYLLTTFRPPVHINQYSMNQTHKKNFF
jgi:hypothetical protein